MGNSMCKSQDPNRSRNAFDEFFAGCTNFCTCPSAISSHRNHHWKKQVIETRPPYLGAHTTSTKWHQAQTLTSTQPLKQQNYANGGKPPVPPPRKKRVMKKARSYEDVLDIHYKKAGFKDVFGVPESLEHQTTSTSHTHIYHLDDNRSNSSSCGNSLKIGNKKSDKFFGESLSGSLSNEPYTPEEGILSRSNDKDELDMFVERNVKKLEHNVDKSSEERLSDNLDKKAAFLMTMLDNYDEKNKNTEDDDDERYRGMVPVEEEIIVPKKKITRCICDETDHLLHHLRHDECKNHTHAKVEDDPDELKKMIVEKKDAATETPPVKPKRDLTLYRKSLELSDSVPANIERTPSPPLRRKRSLNTSKEALTVAPDENERLNDRSESPSTILTKDLMDQIVKHAFPHFMDIEDMQNDSHIDGSAAVSEKISKLKERKVSLNRKISTDSSHSNHSNFITSQDLPASPSPFDTVTEGKPLMGCYDVTISPLSFKEEPVRVGTPERETKLKKSVSIEQELVKEKSSSPVRDARKSVTPEKEPKRSVSIEREPSFEKFDLETQHHREPQHTHHLQDDGVNMLEELIRHQHFNTAEDVINEIYKNQSNIVFEFQRFLEEELNKEENASKLEGITEMKSKKFDTPVIKETPEETIESQSIDLVSNSTSSETSSEASTIKNLSDNDSDVFKSHSPNFCQDNDWLSPETSDLPFISETHLDLVSSSGSSDNASTIRALSISDPEDDDQIPELIHNNHVTKVKKDARMLEDRRESIEDVDIWFTQHLDLPHSDLSQSLVKEDAKKADFLTYDAAKLYPFGQPRERHQSLTDEFFTTKVNNQKGETTKDDKIMRRSNSES